MVNRVPQKELVIRMEEKNGGQNNKVFIVKKELGLIRRAPLGKYVCSI